MTDPAEDQNPTFEDVIEMDGWAKTQSGGLGDLLPELVEWMDRHQLQIRFDTEAKAFEYGNTDIKIMAYAIRQAQPQLDEQDAILWALGFYGLGKVARILSSFQEGRPTSRDSWKDLEVYAMMAQKILDTGNWP